MIERGAAWNRGLRGGVALFASLLALVPLLIVASLAINSILRSHRAADEERLRSTASALAAAVDAQLGAYLASVITLASSHQLDGDVDATVFAMRSREVGEHFDGWVVLLDGPPDYRILMVSNQPSQDSLPAELPPDNRRELAPLLAEVFEHGRPAISDLFRGAVMPRPLLTAMVPVFREHQPLRALALTFEPAALREVLARQRLAPETFAAVADGELRILAHSFDPDGRRVGVRAPGWVASAIEGKQRALVVGPGWSGEDNVYAVERLTLAPHWTVTVAEPLAAQRAAAWEELRWLLAAGAALGLGLAIVVWVGRRETLLDAQRESEALRAGRAEIERLHEGLPAVIFLSRIAMKDGSLSVQRLYRTGDTNAVLGWPTKDLATLPNLQSIADYGEVPMAFHFRRTLEIGEHKWEWRVRRKDGTWSAIRTRARLLQRLPDGSADVVGYNLNIDREREAEARSLAAARLASLGEMAAGLSHEIKQPLQSISLGAEMVQFAIGRGNKAEADRFARQILSEIQRTADLVEHLRRFARGADEVSSPVQVPLAVAIDSTLQLARSALHQAGIGVEVKLADPAPVALGKAVLIEQVLSNILLNARDALIGLPVGALRQIRIAAGPGLDGTVKLTVADTGKGIAPEVMSRLFDPFVTTKGPDRGTGLGLSICHGLVKGMGGTIEARNGADGAVFTITLPAASSDSHTAPVGPERALS